MDRPRAEVYARSRVAAPPPPGSESAGPSMVQLVEELRETATEIRRSYLALRRDWSLYRETAAVVTSANAASLTSPPAPSGFEVEIERITLSVGGVSAAATAAIYLGAGANEQTLEDVISALVGNTPSRVLRSYMPPIRLRGDERLTVVLASTAGGSNQCYARFEGRKREH